MKPSRCWLYFIVFFPCLTWAQQWVKQGSNYTKDGQVTLKKTDGSTFTIQINSETPLRSKVGRTPNIMVVQKGEGTQLDNKGFLLANGNAIVTVNVGTKSEIREISQVTLGQLFDYSSGSASKAPYSKYVDLVYDLRCILASQVNHVRHGYLERFPDKEECQLRIHTRVGIDPITASIQPRRLDPNDSRHQYRDVTGGSITRNLALADGTLIGAFTWTCSGQFHGYDYPQWWEPNHREYIDYDIYEANYRCDQILNITSVSGTQANGYGRYTMRYEEEPPCAQHNGTGCKIPTHYESEGGGEFKAYRVVFDDKELHTFKYRVQNTVLNFGYIFDSNGVAESTISSTLAAAVANDNIYRAGFGGFDSVFISGNQLWGLKNGSFTPELILTLTSNTSITNGISNIKAK